MPNKLTTEIFVGGAVAKHGTFYNYDDTIYVTDEDKVKIICPKHGLFEQRPSTHLRGCNCPACGIENRTLKLFKTTADFIEKANKVHNFKYTYDDADYTKRRHGRIIITCQEHGNFEQSVDKHLSGQGCKSCAIKYQKPSVGFTKSAWLKHCKNKNVDITYCYIMRLFNENESFLKIGITYDLTTRVYHFPYSIETFYIISGTPDIIYDKEQELHKIYKDFKYKPQIPFNGQTECFTLNIFK